MRSLLLWVLSASLATTNDAACLDPFSTLCVDAATDARGVVVFNASCLPSPGSKSLTWCGFGFSTSSATTMFPATIAVIQIAPNGSIFLEDRDARQGYSLPPCFAEQASTLVSASLDAASGALRATWTRAARATPAQKAAGYADFVGAMTAIGASSADGVAVSQACADYMTPHTLVQPGVPFSFPAAAAPQVSRIWNPLPTDLAGALTRLPGVRLPGAAGAACTCGGAALPCQVEAPSGAVWVRVDLAAGAAANCTAAASSAPPPGAATIARVGDAWQLSNGVVSVRVAAASAGAGAAPPPPFAGMAYLGGPFLGKSYWNVSAALARGW